MPKASVSDNLGITLNKKLSLFRNVALKHTESLMTIRLTPAG